MEYGGVIISAIVFAAAMTKSDATEMEKEIGSQIDLVVCRLLAGFSLCQAEQVSIFGVSIVGKLTPKDILQY
jgi:hypothetical protein